MRARSGFTLVELLLASAIMGVILTALAGLFVSSIRANQANTRLAEGQQNIEAAIQLLKYEIALAGYRGTDRCAENRQFTAGPTLLVIQGSGANNPDNITVRYYEDRYASGTESCFEDTIPSPILQTVTFSIGTDARGVSNLYRQQGSSNQPAVENVTNLKVTDFSPENGLTIQLTFVMPRPNGTPTTTTRNVAIALSNPQQ